MELNRTIHKISDIYEFLNNAKIVRVDIELS